MGNAPWRALCASPPACRVYELHYHGPHPVFEPFAPDADDGARDPEFAAFVAAMRRDAVAGDRPRGARRPGLCLDVDENIRLYVQPRWWRVFVWVRSATVNPSVFADWDFVRARRYLEENVEPPFTDLTPSQEQEVLERVCWGRYWRYRPPIINPPRALYTLQPKPM